MFFRRRVDALGTGAFTEFELIGLGKKDPRDFHGASRMSCAFKIVRVLSGIYEFRIYFTKK